MKRFSSILALLATLGANFCLPLRAQQSSQDAPDKVVTIRAVAPREMALGADATLEIHLKIAPKFHVNANPASEEFLIPVEVETQKTDGLIIGKPKYPAGVKMKLFSPLPVSVYEGEAIVRVPLSVSASARPGTRTLRGTVHYQACNDKTCLLPRDASFALTIAVGGSSAPIGGATDVIEIGKTTSFFSEAETLRRQFNVVGLPAIVFLDGDGRERAHLRAGEELTRAGMIEKLNALRSGARLETDAHSAGGWSARLANAPFLLQLALAFFGGLLLNLTPCVYPMIPITIGYFGAQSGGRMSKTFGLAVLYVLGLALVYSSLGVLAARTGTLFGSALQSPIVVGLVALILFVFALSMFGLFTIQPPQFLMQRSGAKKGGLGALGMGALLGVVAAPCVGPVVAALLTYVGTKGDALLGFSLFFALSLGLGLPYLFLGLLGGTIKSLPRSGAWLERSKKIFAVPLLLAALFYGYTAVRAATIPAVDNSSASKHWPNATQIALQKAHATKQPVVLDFRADWCLPCLKIEREVFAQDDVKIAAKNVQLLQVDLTRAGS